ncbi:hypothetical protein QF037_002301 [Streptomyces canus]|nr:hypothetical protein [Streptomyces canus]
MALRPVLRERGRDAVDGRTAHLDMRVPPLGGVARVAAPFLRDPDAAGEGGVLVDDEGLEVATVILLERRQPGGFAEPGHLHARGAHEVQQPPLDLLGAEAVEQIAVAQGYEVVACGGGNTDQPLQTPAQTLFARCRVRHGVLCGRCRYAADCHANSPTGSGSGNGLLGEPEQPPSRSAPRHSSPAFDAPGVRGVVGAAPGPLRPREARRMRISHRAQSVARAMEFEASARAAITQSQCRRLKMTYKLVQTTDIRTIAKGYPNTQCNSGMWSKFIP